MEEQITISDEHSINSLLQKSSKSENNQIIRFIIEGIEFAIDIMDVKEIKEIDRIRRLPNSKKYVAGLLNLRGDIIPVIDLKKRLEIENMCLEDLAGGFRNIKGDGNESMDEDNQDGDLVNNAQEEISESETLQQKDESNNYDSTDTYTKLENELFNLANEDTDQRNIIICNIENTLFGIIVVRIVQVQYLSEGQFEPTPELLTSMGQKFLQGFAKINNQIIPVLKLYKLIFEETE